MSVVDYTFYTTVYMGTEATATSFPALNARASDLIGAMTRWAVDENNITRLPAKVQELYKKAICAQVDALAINGTESLADGVVNGFTVGKVTVQGRQAQQSGGRLAACVSALAVGYLEQTGLLNPAVPALDGWWRGC